MFVSTHFINNEVANISREVWTTKEKEKVQKYFKDKYLMINVLSIKEYSYIYKVALPKKCVTPLK